MRARRCRFDGEDPPIFAEFPNVVGQSFDEVATDGVCVDSVAYFARETEKWGSSAVAGSAGHALAYEERSIARWIAHFVIVGGSRQEEWGGRHLGLGDGDRVRCCMRCCAALETSGGGLRAGLVSEGWMCVTCLGRQWVFQP